MANLRSGDKIRLAPDFLRMHDMLRTFRGGDPLYLYEVREEGDVKIIVLTPTPPAPCKDEPTAEALGVNVSEDVTAGDRMG